MPGKRLAIVALLAFTGIASADDLTNDTAIEITRTWSQEPTGWTYPMAIRVPEGPAPEGGFPVCILLHGNGGNGPVMVMQKAWQANSLAGKVAGPSSTGHGG